MRPKPPITHQLRDLGRLPSALSPLKDQMHWLNWRWEARGDKWTKTPFQVRDPRAHAKTNDSSTWGSYEQAVRRVHDDDADGIGFVLLGASVGAIDLDKCCTTDPKTRVVDIDSWARVLRDEAVGAYCELTVSGTGLRIIGRGEGDRLQRRFNMKNERDGAGIELFRDTERYITVSGIQMGKKCAELPPLDDFLDDLRARCEAERRPSARAEPNRLPRDHTATIRNGAPPGGRSEAFQAAVWHRAATGHSLDQIEAELRKYPNGIAEKYLAPKDRLREEIERSYSKWAAQPDGAVRLDDFLAYMPTHEYLFCPTREMWSGASVNARIPPPAPKLPATAWLDRHRAVEQMTWAPGLAENIEGWLISGGGWIERPGCRVFNLYRPPTLIPRAGPIKPWLDHVRRIYGESADHIIRWLAHHVQRPGEKVNHALVLGGAQGIGKDTMLEPIKRAIGPWNWAEVTPQQLLGRFNGYLKSVVLRVSEARDLGDSDRFAFYDHMKAYTASPPDVLRVDEKFRPEIYIPNVTGVIITTNHKTDGIFLPADDRRHYVAWSEATKEEFPPEYWNKLWKWYNDGGIEAVAHYLATLDLAAFYPKAPPPKTAAFWAIVDASRTPEDAELADALDRLGQPAAVTVEDVKKAANEAFREWLADRRNSRAVPHRFEECGYTRVRNPDAKDGYWKISKKRLAVFARGDMSERDRLIAARRLADGDEPGILSSDVHPFRRPSTWRRREDR